MAGRMMIFLCDDDGDEVLFLGSALQTLNVNFEIKSFLKCSDLMCALEHGSLIPDLIILDLSMPEESGMLCLKKIRSKANFSDIPVIIHSTSALAKDVDAAFFYGAGAYVMKTSSESDYRRNILQVFQREKGELLRPSRERFFVQPAALKS